MVGITRDAWMSKTNYQNSNVTKISQLNNLSDKTKEKIKYLMINNNSIKDLNGVQDLKGLYLLRAESNELVDVDELANVNLSYLYLPENNLGKDNNEDALKGLENIENSHSDLYYLRISNNDIVKVSFLSTLATSERIKYVYGRDNSNIKDVSTLLELVKICMVDLDNKYSISLLDPETTTSKSFNNQTLSFDNLLSIGKCTNMTILLLEDVVITDDEGRILTSIDTNSKEDISLAREKVEEMLKKLVNIKVLSLEKCKFINSLDFINSWNDDGRVYYINVAETNITTLAPINKLINVDCVSCYGCPCGVNTLSNDKIKHLLNCSSDQIHFSRWVASLDIDSNQVENFVIPSDLTSVCLLSGRANIDFSGVSGITTFHARDSWATYTLDPTNLVSLISFQPYIKFSEEKTGRRLCCCSNRYDVIQNALNSFESVDLKSYKISIDFETFYNCDKIISISDSGSDGGALVFSNMNKLTNLEKIDFTCVRGINISDVSNLTSLTSVKIESPVGDDILKKLPISNLTYLELTNSSFTDVSPLMKAENLVTLNLKGNQLYDRFSYEDDSGEQHVNVSTLGIFVELNKDHLLKNLYLDGSKNIRDMSPLLENGVVWTDKSGF